jgi:hypothetical protein
VINPNKISDSDISDAMNEKTNNVGKSIWETASNVMPGLVISYKTAIIMRPDSEGKLYFTGERDMVTTISGLTYIIFRGNGHISGDKPFMNNIYIASPERLLLENLEDNSCRRSYAPAAGKGAVKNYLQDFLIHNNIEDLERLLEKANVIASILNNNIELCKLRKIALQIKLEQKEVQLNRIEIGNRKVPFDQEFLDSCASLITMMAESPSFQNFAKTNEITSDNYEAFYDVILSNYLEGNEFSFQSLISIIYDKKIPIGRKNNARDILETFKIVSSNERIQTFCGVQFGNFIDELKILHKKLMRHRKDCFPGQLRHISYGDSEVVSPRQITGTLKTALNLIYEIDNPVARAVFLNYMICSIQPFLYANGIIARILMNRELVSFGYKRLLIPANKRNEYILFMTSKTPSERLRRYSILMQSVIEISRKLEFRDLYANTNLLHSHT